MPCISCDGKEFHAAGLQTKSNVHRTSDESLASDSVDWLQNEVGNEMQCHMSERQVLEDTDNYDQFRQLAEQGIRSKQISLQLSSLQYCMNQFSS